MSMTPRGDWNSTTDLPAVATWLRGAKRIVVLTHVKPDGDAVGSTMALTRALNRAAGREVATPWYWGPLPDWMDDIAGSTKYRVITEQEQPHHDHSPDPDAVIILDTGSWTQLHEVREWLLERHEIAGVIDHHRQGDADVAPRRVVQPTAAAVCEPVAEVCRLVLGLASVSKLPVDVAEPLYTGLCTDTGWFRHSNVSPGAMRLAAELLDAGVDHAKLYQWIAQRDRVSRLRLMARALGSLELHHNNRVAVMSLTLKDFEDCHAAPTDSGGFSELPLDCEEVAVSVILTEAFVSPGQTGHITKASFRAKAGGVDVGAVAAKLGGGGHIPAAGAKLNLPLAEARKRVIEALK